MINSYDPTYYAYHSSIIISIITMKCSFRRSLLDRWIFNSWPTINCRLLLLLFFSMLWIGSTSANRYYPSAFAASQISYTHSSGRRWKNRRKRQTFFPSPVRQITPQEEAALLEQLGYVPPNVCRIAARSGGVDISSYETNANSIGRPISIQSYPLLVQILNSKEENMRDYTPFPTLYWLTCPHVSRAISEIERNGYVRKFQLRLENDESLAKEWWQCHEEYATERWELLSESDREWLLSNSQVPDEQNSPEQRKVESMREMIQYSGVAGTDHRRLREKDDDNNNKKDASLCVPSVKCLHSHYAHYRSQKESETTVVNIIGKWTHELLMEEFPDLVI
jgi:hypothetical protein